ncbi:MAG TPA: MFS transporter [Candidatus Polarisedimenticolaceae bacterium]
MNAPGTKRLLRKEVLGWCAFDFANSSYTTLITTVAFSVYFTNAVFAKSDPRGDLYWGLAGIAVNVALILTSPVMGALADYSGRKKRFLAATVLQTVVATALLATVGPGDVFWAFVLYVVASIGFEGGYVFYNAFLPEISDDSTAGKISALAWGTGFLGGLISLLACLWFIARPLTDPSTGALDLTAVARFRGAFLVVAAFFALFSIPTFLWLRERPSDRALSGIGEYASVGFRRVGETLRHLRDYRETAKYILAYVFFFGGVNVVIRFSAIFASKSFGIEGIWLLVLFMSTNLIAFPGTVTAGWIADRIGARRALALTLVLWTGVALIGAFAKGIPMFCLMAAGAAIGMGSTQSIARAYMARLSPRERESEFFGFYVLAGQVGSIVAFLVFGLVSSGSGSQRLAVLWTVPFFVIGLLLVLWIDEARARRDTAPGA